MICATLELQELARFNALFSEVFFNVIAFSVTILLTRPTSVRDCRTSTNVMVCKLFFLTILTWNKKFVLSI